MDEKRTRIFVVMGTTGEYSDRTEWPVLAFTDKTAAEKLVVQASRRAAEIHNQPSNGLSYRVDLAMAEARGERLEPLNEFDPEMQMDYTGTFYEILEVDLVSRRT